MVDSWNQIGECSGGSTRFDKWRERKADARHREDHFTLSGERRSGTASDPMNANTSAEVLEFRSNTVGSRRTSGPTLVSPWHPALEFILDRGASAFLSNNGDSTSRSSRLHQWQSGARMAVELPADHLRNGQVVNSVTRKMMNR